MLEKTINGKTYARVGNPANGPANYWEKKGENNYDVVATAAKPQPSHNINSATHDFWTGETTEPKHIAATINPERKIFKRNASPFSSNPAYQPNSTKEDIKAIEDRTKSLYSSNNPNAEQNRKSYFQDEMGYKGDWAKKADEEIASPKMLRWNSANFELKPEHLDAARKLGLKVNESNPERGIYNIEGNEDDLFDFLKQVDNETFKDITGEKIDKLISENNYPGLSTFSRIDN